ncbi:hypothetical protein [Streptomyces sp. NPDC102462]|uniref:hypothetical protein n=1 Tax=Streptomyces sp. NPDC102462 TaxID=3366178 RepID=UPI0037F39C0A
MTTTVTALPTAEQVSALAKFGTDQVQQTADKLKQRLPELAEEPRTAEAELILGLVPEEWTPVRVVMRQVSG